MEQLLFQPDLENGNFSNPIIFADYSDPDVIRVDDTYYLTASSFNYVPGLPILISKDLVNWTLVNYALTSIPGDFDRPRHSQGVWAPSIRYHEGEFYIYYGMPDEGFFMVKTKNPLGKWEEPVCILEGKGLIDCCPFWDEDGKAYIIHGYAKSRIGFKSHLGIFEMNWEGTKAITEDHILYSGLETNPTIEGPKVYKKDGFYYILAPAGGVKTGWQEALRSKNIYGPYEEMKVLEQGDTEINGPHQGGLVTDVSGQDWFVHFQDRGLYGRICHLQPVNWVDGWPVMGTATNNYCGQPVLEMKKPACNETVEVTSLEASDDFNEGKLGLMWQWLANPKEAYGYVDNQEKQLVLNCVNFTKKPFPILWEQGNVLTQKLVCPEFQATVKLGISGLLEGDQAGVVMMGGAYSYIGARALPKNRRILVHAAYNETEDKGVERVNEIAEIPAEISDVYITFSLKEGPVGPIFEMFYGFTEGEKLSFTDLFKFVPSDHTWVGAKIGLFANCLNGNEMGGKATFDYIHVERL